jgi:hypothetical protein
MKLFHIESAKVVKMEVTGNSWYENRKCQQAKSKIKDILESTNIKEGDKPQIKGPCSPGCVCNWDAGKEYKGENTLEINHRFIKQGIKIGFGGISMDLDCQVKGTLKIVGRFILAGCKKPDPKKNIGQ